MGAEQCFGMIGNDQTDKKNVAQYIKHIKEKNQIQQNFKRHFSCSDAYDSHNSLGQKTLSTIYTETFRSSLINTGKSGGFFQGVKQENVNMDDIEEMNFYMSFASRFPHTRIGQKSLRILLNNGDYEERSKSMKHLRRKKLDD